METVTKIINKIKSLAESNIEDISTYILKEFFIEIENFFYSKEDIVLLVDLVLQNTNLSSNVLANIFVNSRNKTEYTVLVSIDKNDQVQKNKFSNEKQVLEFLNTFGKIFILPEKIRLLWNEKYKTETTKKIEAIAFDYDNLTKNEDDKMPFNDNNRKFTNNYTRVFGLEEPKDYFFFGKWQMTVDINNVKLFTSLLSNYTGDVQTIISGNILNFSLRNSGDLLEIIEKNKNNLLKELVKFPNKTLSYAKAFFENNLLQKNNDLYFNALTKEIKKYKTKEYKNFQIVEKKINSVIEIQNIIDCEHIANYENIFKNENYFEDVNNFINNYINYIDGRAVCNLCGETVIGLNIQAVYYGGTENKNVVYIDDILKNPPYNKFLNLNFFLESLINNYIYITKVGVYNFTTIGRMLIDNLLHINANRTNLEIVYNEDIAANRIFFLRLSNNFFDIYDFEKEKYKEKRFLYTNIPAYLMILTTASLSDYYDLFFYKKTISLKKINKDISQIKFEDVIAHILNFVLKKIIVDYEDKKDNKIKRTIEIYKEIFNEEFKLVFEQKKILFENYLQKLSLEEKIFDWDNMSQCYIGGQFGDYNDKGFYQKELFVVDFIRPNSELNYYKTREKKLENIIKYKNTIDKDDDFTVNNTNYNKVKKILNIDFFSDLKLTKEEIKKIDLTLSEILQEKIYTYKNKNYFLECYNNVYILESVDKKLPSIEFLDTYLLDIKGTNVYTHNELIEGDEFLYIKDIKNYHFERIMKKFYNFIYKKYNIEINSNLSNFSYSDQIINRQLLFSWKCRIINLCV